jgi:AcrR family transcriptional regulator
VTRSTGRPRTRLEPELRRELILDSAERAFAGRDPADVTFEEVAEGAGVSRALVYNYFGDRGGLLAAVYVRVIARLDERLTKAIDAATPPAERLRLGISSYVAFARENPELWKLIGVAELVRHPAVDAARRARYDALTAAWGGTPGARMLARGFVGFLESATLALLEPATLPDERPLSDEEAVELLHQILWNGLSALSVAVP